MVEGKYSGVCIMSIVNIIYFVNYPVEKSYVENIKHFYFDASILPGTPFVTRVCCRRTKYE
jgi:hypothetical protein